MFGSPTLLPPSIEEVRKKAQILIVDDQDWPYQQLLAADGYHVERWAEVQSLSRLTDGYYTLILLDLHGVGLQEARSSQGVGILEHIKRTNPAQRVIVYSAKKHMVSTTTTLSRADAIFDKSDEYTDYKAQIDEFLVSGTSVGYFVAAMNKELGEDAVSVPKYVPKAIKALRSGQAEGLRQYLTKCLSDRKKIDTLMFVAVTGIKIIKAFHGQ